MQKIPQISIIIPTLNEEKLIKKTLSQFTPELKNSYKFEVIISDGGSTDNTLNMLTEIVDKVVKEAPGVKQNIPKGRNVGANSASGEYLYFLNADTMLEDTQKFFINTLAAFEVKKNLALTCRFNVFPGDVRISDMLFHGFYNNYVRLLNKAGMGMGRGECQIIRRNIFEQVNGYNENLAAGEDYDLYRRINKLGKGRIKFLNDIVIYESPRRYRKYGYIKVFAAWTRNSFSVFFRNRSVSKEWEAVR